MTIISGQSPVTFRRDRFGECWHIIPAGELGPRSRTLCGQPRQGTPLSETYAEIQPLRRSAYVSFAPRHTPI